MNAYKVQVWLYEDGDFSSDCGWFVTIATSLDEATRYVMKSIRKAEGEEEGFKFKAISAVQIDGILAIPKTEEIIPYLSEERREFCSETVTKKRKAA